MEALNEPDVRMCEDAQCNHKTTICSETHQTH